MTSLHTRPLRAASPMMHAQSSHRSSLRRNLRRTIARGKSVSCGAIWIVLVSFAAHGPVCVAETNPLVVLRLAGSAIFEHQWKPGRPASPGGDGLGPVHNDVSCVACHHQGGAGGGGGIEKNATLLTLMPKLSGLSKRRFHNQVSQLHPGLVGEGGDLKRTIVLHKFSTDANYSMSRQQFVGIEMPVAVSDASRPIAERMVAEHPVRRIAHASGVSFQLSQRNSPALFGAGLIDAVPDRLLRRLEKRQQKRGLVSGRVSPVDSRVGKFGWRGQTATLREFVRDACANELGLQVPGGDQAMHPMHLDYKPPGLDLNATQLHALVRFVSMLPRPKGLTPDDNATAAIARKGRTMFAKAGCAECHVETLGTSRNGIRGIFSDLLLHDMGPSLADPALANPLTVEVEIEVPAGLSAQTASPSGSQPSPPSSGGSYGGGGGSGTGLTTGPSTGRGTKIIRTDRIIPTNRHQEWRTPPLWGVSQSGPYLHDGRASTLTEAILYHGGEAKFSVQRYLQLPPADRIALVEFLRTLIPPSISEI